MKPLPRRILVPVDFEHASRRALRYARALAAASGADVELLHVIPMPAGHVETRKDAWWTDLARKTLAGLAERARFAPGTRTEVLCGPVASSIATHACDNGFDLMILGGRSAPDWQGSLLGSTAAAILRHTCVPVLIVPAPRPSREASESRRTAAGAAT